MRSVPATLQSEIQGQTTRPGFLVYLGFDPELYMCSWADVTWNGHNWSFTGLDVQRLGTDKCTVRVDNSDRSMSSLILNQDVLSVPIEVYIIYFDAQWNGTEPYLYFKGFCDGAELSNPVVASLSAVVFSRANYYSPRKRICEATGFHYLPREGQVVSWGNNTVLID